MQTEMVVLILNFFYILAEWPYVRFNPFGAKLKIVNWDNFKIKIFQQNKLQEQLNNFVFSGTA